MRYLLKCFQLFEFLLTCNCFDSLHVHFCFATFRYEDFFGGNKKKDVKRNSELIDGSEDSDTGDEQENGEAFKSQVGQSITSE